MFHDPVRMVLLGLIGIAILLTGTFFYLKIYPKKKINWFIYIILISFLPVISIFRPGVYESGDFTLHIYRTIDFYNSLKEGIIMPSWAGMLNATYGYSIFIFINPLPYYLISLFHFVGFDFIWSMKLFLSLMFIGSGIFMFLFAKKTFKNDLSAFGATLFYLFAPYHLVDQHFRVDVGEICIFTLFPLLLLLILSSFKKRGTLNFFLLSLVVSFIVLSHQAMAAFVLGFSVVYTGYVYITQKSKSKSQLIYFSSALLLGLAVSFYALFPYIVLAKYTIANTYKAISFPPIWQLFFSPWRYGFLFQGPQGEISPMIGYAQLGVVLLLLALLLKKRIRKNLPDALFWVGIFLICLFMMLPVSGSVWYAVPLLTLAIIATRLMLFAVFASAVIAGILIDKFYVHKKIIVLILFIVISSTLLNWGNRKTIETISNSYLEQHVWQATSMGEGWGIGITKWRPFFGWEAVRPANSLEIKQGKGVVTTVYNKETAHTYVIEAATNLVMQENIWYFPGWHVLDNNKEVAIAFAKKENNGYIVFSLTPGEHNVQVFYKDIPQLAFVKQLSLLFFVFTIGGIVFGFLKAKSREKLLD